MKYEKDIYDWTLKLGVKVVFEYKKLRKNRVDFAIANQFLRSGTSIGANVTEGKASSSRKELIRYYEIALRSAHETEYWIRLIQSAYSENNIAIEEELKKEINEIIKVISSIVLKLKKTIVQKDDRH